MRGRAALPGVAGAVAGALITALALPNLVAPQAASPATDRRAVQLTGPGPSSPDGTGGSDDGKAADGSVASVGTAATIATGGVLDRPSEREEPAAAAGRTTDVGLTAERVRLGFVLLDLGGSGAMGFDFGLDPAQQELAIRAAVDDLNERGGLAGRLIEPTFATFNVLDSFTSGGGSGRAACLKLTEDHRVFAVVGYLFPADQLCVTKEHETPLLSDAANNLDSVFAAAEGRLLSVYPRASRLMAIFVDTLDRARFLHGKKVGIVGERNADPQGEVVSALRDELVGAGHEVTRISQLSGDISVGASQMPVEVNQQRAAGTEVILFLTHPLYVQQFAQQAESQGWRPHYGFSDFANGTTDPANDMPESLDGALGAAGAHPGAGTKDTAGWPEPPAASACRANYERRSGRRLAARGSGDNRYSVTLIACDDLRILEEIGRLAGPSLTRRSFIDAVPRVGVIDGLGRIPGGSYGPGKPDLADFVRLQRYDSSCQCFHPQGPFRRTP